jgi:hypothetical protein
MPEPVSDGVAGETESGSAVVDVRARERTRMVTHVQLRQLGTDGPWTVIGSLADNIHVSMPEPMQVVGSTIALAGSSTAFEATVNVEVREVGDGTGEHLGETIVMGGGGGELEPFTGEVTIEASHQAAGAVIFKTLSAEDGAVMEATVVRVQLEQATGTAFSVYFHRGEELVEVHREEARRTDVLRGALESLFRGPQPSDGDGLSSFFSDDTADLLADLNLRDGTAIVDLAATVSNASTSTGSTLLLEELNATVFQFPTVERVEYRLQGDCDAFWQWLQYGDCRVVDRP